MADQCLNLDRDSTSALWSWRKPEEVVIAKCNIGGRWEIIANQSASVSLVYPQNMTPDFTEMSNFFYWATSDPVFAHGSLEFHQPLRSSHSKSVS